MDYIGYLRNMVGHEPVIMVAAGVVILNAEGELLMQRRADGSGWGLVGGFVELGESVEEAARREVLEETGLNVGKLELFGVFSAPELLTYPNGDRAQVVTISYHASRASGTPRLSSEGLELRYFALNALPDNLFTPNLPILEAFQTRFGGH